MRRIRVCPSCKSTDIVHDTSNPLEAPLGLPERLMCRTCGFSGYVFPTMPASEVQTYKKNTKGIHPQAELIDTSYGNFAVRALWKVTSPTLFVIGAIFLLSGALWGMIPMFVATVMMYITYGLPLHPKQ